MKKLVLCILMICLNVFGQEKNFLDKPYMEVVSRVDTLVVPNIIHLSIVLKEKDTKGKISVEELEKQMFQSLTGLGIDIEKELSLTDVASNFKKYFLKSADVHKTKIYNLIVHDAATAGNVIGELELLGISNVDLKKTEVSNAETIELKLKQKAILKAKQKAKMLLGIVGQSVGKVLFLDETNPNIMDQLQGRLSGVDISAGGYMTSIFKKKKVEKKDIAFKKIELTTQIKVRFEIL